jgi:hypothetical protein
MLSNLSTVIKYGVWSSFRANAAPTRAPSTGPPYTPPGWEPYRRRGGPSCNGLLDVGVLGYPQNYPQKRGNIWELPAEERTRLALSLSSQKPADYVAMLQHFIQRDSRPVPLLFE